MKYDIVKNNRNLICRTRTLVDEKRDCFIKIIIGNSEEEIIKEFLISIKKIMDKEVITPQFFTFNRRDFTSFIYSRIVKYNITESKNVLPLNKWKIEDLRDKFGNFNNETTLFEYFNLPETTERIYKLKDITEDINILKSFFINTTNKINNLSIITSRLMETTYSDHTGPKIIVTIEVEPLIDLKEKFLKTFPYLKENSEEDIIRFMKNNLAFSRILGITISNLDYIIKKEEG